MDTAEANAIVLAGGRGRRLGADKALVMLGGAPLITHIVRRLAPITRRIIVAGRDRLPEGCDLPRDVSFAADAPGEEGPLAGIHAGLQASGAELNVIAGCDMPFVGAALVSLLLARAAASDAAIVTPEWQSKRQVLCSVYRRNCLPILRAALDTGERSPWDFQKRVRALVVPEDEVRRVDPEGRSFFNVNTPDDLRAAELLSQRDGYTL